MTNVSLLVYLLVCPFNLKYVLDFPSYVHEMYRREECKDLSTHYRKRGIDVYSQQSQAYVPHSEEHLYEDAEIYFEIILRSKKDIRKNQKENYDKVVNSFVSDKKEYSLKSIHSSEEVIELYYVHVFTNRIIKIKIEKKKEIKNYLHLFFTNYCIYKLSNHDYNRVKNGCSSVCDFIPTVFTTSSQGGRVCIVGMVGKTCVGNYRNRRGNHARHC
ncbi:GPI-anchored wall transfer protein 1, putative (GWT1) [Plasmodium ovale wallikeri]|uniref:GPI-anchored wall transfer protein 1, putative (GWT1) n=1 Tax=Plasmodium ovale wallikeri TaxID=864142 RepID=A0A1A8Z3Z3_PLAOA|nr:GPI-anchored wall transfer protein 1, putative (GWT1) [Plasmodium ovale wallikeri]SBT39197.1 GPI-anchored wall transfer protein 1, putative (GWT1) [Plasmodium ovale wallikeri]